MSDDAMLFAAPWILDILGAVSFTDLAALVSAGGAVR
jgi:hypothetical protein